MPADRDRNVVDESPDHIDRPQFNTDQIVNWNYPCCEKDGFDTSKTADCLPLCTNADCPVRMFSVFRGEIDEWSAPKRGNTMSNTSNRGIEQ